MAARDPNNATWYMLRYASDFTPHEEKPAWTSPSFDGALVHDDQRHVVELRPTRPADRVEPLTGLAVGMDGEVYRIDPETGELLVTRCDCSEAPLGWDGAAVSGAAGLAFDGRGLLYVADPAARRVLVVDPIDGVTIARLVDGLQDPVDVAVANDGWIFVADRSSGRIVVFTPSFSRAADWRVRDAEGLLSSPRPVAVIVAEDGAILVADEAHPRLLRLSRSGEPLGDVDLHREVRGLPDDVRELDLARCNGAARPFFPGRPGGCVSVRTGARMEALHRALRLRRLHLGSSFETSGTFVSRALDGGAPGTTWHKVIVEADLPPGTWLELDFATSDDPAKLAAPAFESGVVMRDGGPPDALIRAARGRHLRLRLVLRGGGGATPSVRSIRVLYPRTSYLDLLPRALRSDPESAVFLERYLALFEHVFTNVEEAYEEFSRDLSPDVAPMEIITWLGCLVDLSFDPSWPVERRRALVAAAMELYRTRGTIEGIARYIEIYTGVRPEIVEGFAERPSRPAFLGVPGSVLGCTTRLDPARAAPEEALWQEHAHRFTVVLHVARGCDIATIRAVVEKILVASKPAHTLHRLEVLPVGAGAEVGFARVGLDVVLGERIEPATRLGECPPSGSLPGARTVLGVDSILGDRRPPRAVRGIPELT